MLAVKIHNEKENRGEEFKRTIKNLVSYVCEKLSFDNVKIVSDDECVEIVSGSDKNNSEDQVIAELLIRKTVVINNNDFKDRAELDKFISQIKHFCDQAKLIEDVKYYPVEIRKPK
jgi:type III secretory pathway lipoprotein EscJ